MDKQIEARKLHQTLEFTGLRAQATAVGLLQLCAELVEAKVLDNSAIDRIKGAIHRDIVVANPRGRNREEFARTLQRRLDTIFPRSEEANPPASVGTTQDFEEALGVDPLGTGEAP